MKKVVLSLVCLLPLLTSACNTMEGFGTDVERGGEKIQRSADRNR